MPKPRKSNFDPRKHMHPKFGRPMTERVIHTKKVIHDGVNYVLLAEGNLAIIERGKYYPFPNDPALERTIRNKLGFRE